MTLKISHILVVCLLALVLLQVKAQSLEHPVIWATAGERAHILDMVDTYPWAQSIVSKLHSVVDAKVITHQSNPASILNTIPDLADEGGLSEATASSANAAHSKLLNHASYAGMLYYLTGEEKYAQFAADILNYYIDIIALRIPEKTTICGNAFYDPRASYGQFAIAYDFIIPFLKLPSTELYELSSASKVAFDNVKAQKAIYNIAMDALHESGGADTKYGKMVSNHPVLRAPGVLFPILCVEDDIERERMFQVFWNKGTKEQNSFTKTILPMFGEQGIWPESVSYSFMQNITLILNVIDRLKPELNVMDDNMHILDGNFLFDNLRHPNRRFVTYGDSHRDNDGTGALYRYTLNLATRKGYDSYVQKAKVALRQSYDAEGGYDPSVPISTFGNYNPFEELLWGVNIPEEIEGEINFQKPTVLVKHAGVALQRNSVEENNAEYGLCGIIGGAHYVHSHCTGITMELYGAGYIMAPNGGLPPSLAERKYAIHTDYFWRHAGNNTMIVNGTTHGIQDGAWNSDSYLWMNTTVNVAAEPQHLEDPISENFSFATQFLDDEVNDDQQQRTLGTIRTSPTTGYYFDMFRSKSLGVNNFHDYIYHNIGDQTNLLNANGDVLDVTATNRYQTDIGDSRKSPGWYLFEDAKVTEPVNSDVKVRFDIDYNKRYMHMLMPGGVEREYTKALGPASREAKNGYLNKKTQILAIRQHGEAWNKPFISIFEPSTNSNASVQSVENIEVDGKVVGALVVSQVNGDKIEDFIICLDKEDSLDITDHFIKFKGRFGIVRKQKETESTQTVILYIGQGSSLSYMDSIINAGDDRKEIKTLNGVTKISDTLQYTLETNVLSGVGQIMVSPEKESYSHGDKVTLTAKPADGYIIDEWQGDITGGLDEVSFSMYSNTSITALFRPLENYTLSITSDHGTVNQSLEGTEFVELTTLTLTAEADNKYAFESWSGDVVSTDNPLKVQMNSNLNIKANYTSLRLLSLNINVIGNGKVEVDPVLDGYPLGTRVRLHAIEGDYDYFIDWSGDYISDFYHITFFMDSDINLSANFTDLYSALSEQNVSGIKISRLEGQRGFEINANGPFSYALYNISGVLLKQGKASGCFDLDLCKQYSGVYIVEVVSGNERVVRRLLR